MAQRAIIHSATRVVHVVVKDDSSYVIPIGHEAVEMNPEMDPHGGPWKLDENNRPVRATLEEYQASGHDEAYNDRQALERTRALKKAITDTDAALDDLLASNAAPAMKAVARAQKEMNATLAKVMRGRKE